MPKILKSKTSRHVARRGPSKPKNPHSCNFASEKPCESHSVKYLTPPRPPRPIKSCLTKSCLTTPDKPKPKAKKHVRFDRSVKAWDGQRQENVLLERLALGHWQQPTHVTVLDELQKRRNSKMLLKLYHSLLAAMERTEKNLKSKGAELVPGGGKHGIRLQPCNLPHAKLLLYKISKAHENVVLQTLALAGLNVSSK